MNIFYLDDDPRLAAQYMCDKHVVKMIVETAQLLSTAHHVLDENIDEYQVHDKIYKKTHQNHPSAVWVRESLDNYMWGWDHLHHLISEYTYRYGREHKTKKILQYLLNVPIDILEIGLTPIPLCMPDEYKVADDAVQSYRNYYKHGKMHLHKWTKREKPEWMND